MGELYEVLRFIEHGGQCRQSLDCVQGTILIYYLRDHPQVDKSALFGWFMQIGTGLDQYRRCRKGRSYRYLNPYSILVSEEGRMLLLDPDSPENAFIRKKMQQRAVRAHFVRPALEAGRKGAAYGDLFGFGKTVQFMLACTRVTPPLTRREEFRLAKFVDRCTVNEKRKYEDIRQALNDIPLYNERSSTFRGKGRVLFLGSAAVLLLCAVCFGIFRDGSRRGTGRIPETAETVKAAEPSEKPEAAENAGTQELSALPELVRETGAALDAVLLENTAEGNQDVLTAAKELERKALHAFAEACEREEMTDDAILAYGRLLEIEEQKEKVEQAGVRKMELEAESGLYAQAVLTGERVLEKTGSSQTVARLMQEYSAPESGEVQADAAE